MKLWVLGQKYKPDGLSGLEMITVVGSSSRELVTEGVNCNWTIQLGLPRSPAALGLNPSGSGFG